jgi:hypothetical protein
MSPANRHPRSRHLCAGCRSRRARFQYRGTVKADRDHNLCFQCYRSELNRLRARRMANHVWGNAPAHAA